MQEQQRDSSSALQHASRILSPPPSCRLLSLVECRDLALVQVQVPRHRTSEQEVEIHNRFDVLGEAAPKI